MLCYKSNLSHPHYPSAHQCQQTCGEDAHVQAWWLATMVQQYDHYRFTNGVHSRHPVSRHPPSLALHDKVSCKGVIRSPRWITSSSGTETLNMPTVRWHNLTVTGSCSKASVGCSSHCMFSDLLAGSLTALLPDKRCHCFSERRNLRTSQLVIVSF